MNWLYLAAIIFSFVGIMTLDWRHRLACWCDSRRTIMTVLIATVVFVVWDICGISLGIFRSGHSPYMSGIYLFPEFPQTIWMPSPLLRFPCFLKPDPLEQDPAYNTYRRTQIIWSRLSNMA